MTTDQPLDPSRRAVLELNARGHQPDADLDHWLTLRENERTAYEARLAAMPRSARTALNLRLMTYGDLKQHHDVAVAAGVIEPSQPPTAA